jgi:hypothetical protein
MQAIAREVTLVRRTLCGHLSQNVSVSPDEIVSTWAGIITWLQIGCSCFGYVIWSGVFEKTNCNRNETSKCRLLCIKVAVERQDDCFTQVEFPERTLHLSR